MTEVSSGRFLGKYEILERIGRGGMAEVFKAYHPALDRFVAIKLLHPFLADDPEFKNRFEHEAQNVAKLRHTNIVQVYDFEFDDAHESYYMVMELIGGPTLKDVLFDRASAGEGFPLAEALTICQDIGQALGYAHGRGMIHRDVKPANIMHDTENRRYVLTDFGIAKIVTGPQFTASGGMLGTPAYMAPEQALGDPGDERADIYSLGVILYQLCTGRLPYDADTPLAIVLKHVNDPLPNPRDFNPDLPEGVAKIIYRSMAKDPADRYQSAPEMVNHLEDLEQAASMALTGGSDRVSRPVPDDTLRAPDETTPLLQPAIPSAARGRRNWLSFAVVALAALAVAIGVFAVAPSLMGAAATATTAPATGASASPSPTDTRTPTPNFTATADRATLDAVLNAFVTQTAVASETFAAATETARVPTDTPTATVTPTRATASPTPSQTMTPTPVPARYTLSHPQAALGARFSPDGERVVTAGADGVLRLWDVKTGAILRLFEGHVGPVNAVAFHPAAAQLASAGKDGTVRLWNEATGAELARLEDHAGEVSLLAFNLYGARLASAGLDKTVRLWDPGAGAQPVAVLEGHEAVITGIAFSPDGTLLASAGVDGVIRLWRAADGEVVAALDAHDGAVNAIAFNPTDGATLASGGADGTIRLWDALTGAALAEFDAPADAVTDLAYSPTGSMIGSAGADGAVRLWNATTGELLAVLERHTGPVNHLAFGPDDLRLVSAGLDGTLNLWNRQTGAWLAAFGPHADAITAVTFSPDGTVIASASADGIAGLWPVPDAVPVIVPPTRPPSPTPGVAASPTPDRTATVAACNYDYELVARAYEPAYELSPGEFYVPIRASFTTTLTVRNTGECDWERFTELVFVEGESFNSPESVSIPSIIRVGDEYTFEIAMQAPPRNRPHTGVWELRTPAGFRIGAPLEITLYFYDSGGTEPTPSQDEGTPSGGQTGEVLQFSYYFSACQYASEDFVCTALVNPTGGTPPYTVSSSAGSTATGAPYNVQVRSRRCASFAYTITVTDSAGGVAQQQQWFDVEGFAGLFPGGACSTGD